MHAPVAVHLTKPLHVQVTHYEEDEEGVTVHFSGKAPPRRAKLLVGADGYFSKVRSQCLDDGPPDFVVSCTSATLTDFCTHTIIRNRRTSLCLSAFWEPVGAAAKSQDCPAEPKGK